ncbi:hypothetical protein HZH68_015701 [Vespula germanica]|uniref:PiggyBac transposable element-derived protein domain-containing protein n=1 Tax=Vespula germanica TaxID=30212 RepID=A0A834MSY6_VESGE|nr:hypothetical protein HZH68_015701 [Vespula germanica]
MSQVGETINFTAPYTPYKRRFMKNSQNSYNPDMNLTVDEILFSTKVRCKFTQYTPKTKYLRQLRIITKPNLASMLPIKWQESTALNQNPIDGLCMFFFNILDVAGINVWILYKETNGQNISRIFVIDLNFYYK